MRTGSHMHEQAQSGIAKLLGVQKHHYVLITARSMVSFDREHIMHLVFKTLCLERKVLIQMCLHEQISQRFAHAQGRNCSRYI